MSRSEIAKEIVVAAIQNGAIIKASTASQSPSEATQKIADNITDLFKAVYNAVRECERSDSPYSS